MTADPSAGAGREPMRYAEKRRYERASVDIHVRWGLTPDCHADGRVLSLSAGGCFLRTEEAVEPGRDVFVQLWLPGQRPLVGEVRYRIEGYGLGVEFKMVGPVTADQLSHMVEFYSQPTAE
jgi:hypothetical protein